MKFNLLSDVLKAESAFSLHSRGAGLEEIRKKLNRNGSKPGGKQPGISFVGRKGSPNLTCPAKRTS
jgi:hypothetical protein